MANQLKCKLCRREGKKLFLKGERCYTTKCAIVKRNYAPGMHGLKQGPAKKVSAYGRQLREKQSAKRSYNIKEKQLVNYFKKATRKKGNTEETLYQLLELRLDNVIFRLGLAKSRAQARQIISHGHVQVNSKKVNIPSFHLKPGDQISLREKSLKTPLFVNLSEGVKTGELVSWLHLDPKTLVAKVVDVPNYEKSVKEFEMKQIIEFYSR
ncbi:MAG: 30S ribosomal protein S4 [Patescibacteria group bacterium]